MRFERACQPASPRRSEWPDGGTADGGGKAASQGCARGRGRRGRQGHLTPGSNAVTPLAPAGLDRVYGTVKVTCRVHSGRRLPVRKSSCPFVWSRLPHVEQRPGALQVRNEKLGHSRGCLGGFQSSYLASAKASHPGAIAEGDAGSRAAHQRVVEDVPLGRPVGAVACCARRAGDSPPRRQIGASESGGRGRKQGSGDGEHGQATGGKPSKPPWVCLFFSF